MGTVILNIVCAFIYLGVGVLWFVGGITDEDHSLAYFSPLWLIGSVLWLIAARFNYASVKMHEEIRRLDLYKKLYK